MDKSKYKILVISSGMAYRIDIAVMLTKAGFSTYFFAGDFIEAIGMIEKYRPNIMILDLHLLGFCCLGGKLKDIKFATYAWNKFGIPHVYISPASKSVWKEIKLNESRPLAIIKRPFREEALINIINNAFADFEERIHMVAKIRRLLTKEDKTLIRMATKRSKDLGDIEVDRGPCVGTSWQENPEGVISNAKRHEYYATVYSVKSKKPIQYRL